MNTLHLKYAVEVERTKSITQAADNLFMAQPNLSKSIKELEDTIGFPVFERTSKGVIPTRRGSEFLGYARNILKQLDKMEALSKSNKTDIQSLHISIPRASYIAEGFAKFAVGLDICKDMDINVQETDSMQAITNIIEGPFNLGIIRYKISYENYFIDYLKDKNLCYEPIWEFDRLALMSQNHPLASAKEVNGEEITQYPEIIHGDTVIPYLFSDDPKSAKNNQYNQKKIYVYDRAIQFELLMNMMGSYMWVSPIPDKMLERYRLVQRKCLYYGGRYKDLLIYMDGYKFTELDKAFMNKLYESKNDVSLKEYR